MRSFVGPVPAISAAIPSIPTAVPARAPQKEGTRSPHGPLSIPCENCHTAAGWKPIRAVPEFDHNKTKYPLRGMHEKVQCTHCHLKPVFTDVGKNCADCHADIHRRQMGSDCAQCHTVDGWERATQQVKDHQNRFPLFGAHAAVPCDSCHKQAAVGIFLGLSTRCDSCHLEDWQKTNNPPHSAAGPAFALGNCQGCHSFDSWLGAKFDHSTTGFLLTNGHANLACTACHLNNNYNLQIAPTDCGHSGCHLTTWQQTTTPVHSSSGPSFALGNCANCHTTAGWTSAAFDHSTTGFPLVGTHMSPIPTPCASCHVNNNYSLANADCMTCHSKDWNSTQGMGGNVPNHVNAGFPSSSSACSTCHSITKWSDGKFDHSATGFPLQNAHATVQCSQCHINNNYNLQIQPTDCGNAGCHLTTWQETNNPVHASSGPAFATANCAKCHTTVGWDAASFDHSITGWPLTGTHLTTPCAQCHTSNNYSFTSANTDCYGCHQAAWTSTQTLGGNVPNHITAGFPTSQCSSCHDTTSWADSTFNHASTGFPLTNSHQMAPAGKVAACAQCHINNNYNLTIQPTDCGNAGCHLTTWQQTNNPAHPSAGAPFAAANCSTCHNTTTWTSAIFDHSSTGWPLTGSHQLAPAGKVAQCTDCHINNNYTFTAANTDCYGCHQTAWNSTQTLGGSVPNHVTAGFPTSQCSSCHDTINWADGKFDHGTTGFPLSNSHQMAPAGKVTGCAQCHINNNYALKIQPTDCGNAGCHLITWQQTNNPAHPSAGAPFAAANCSACHNTITWTTAIFDHSTTGWPLTGSHQLAPAGKVVACTDCHINNNYTFTSANTDCYGCHQTSWISTQTIGGAVPNHISAGFPTSQCSVCHDTVNWADGKFDHATTGWALTGKHSTTPCASCHVNNNYGLTSANTACYGCHTADWNSTQTLGGSIPNHIAAGYPTTCDTCHNTTAWTGATFNHTYFPIPHHGSVCNDCHQVSTDYSSFTCINCHTQSGAHAQASTDNRHQGVGGYSYGPTTCYNCHKNGGG